MFCDEVTIRLIAGKGGDGCRSFRREKHIPYGGPNGGDGGKGGDVILMATSNINTLSEFYTKKVIRAHHGERGRSKDMTGKDADNLILKVPCGTIVKSEDKSANLTDLRTPGESFIAVKGGIGGKGNAHFATSRRQSPFFAELGEPGEDKKFFLELKLVADVGIIGLPSVGKSTLISKISSARPKIADYPFTTLIPNLGVVYVNKFLTRSKDTFTAADIPGLIEGASQGKGLGHDFLRHISRTAVLVHLVDALSDNPLNDLKIINSELKKFSPELAQKKQIIVVNKIDAVSKKRLIELEQHFAKKKFGQVRFISAVTGTNIRDLVVEMWKALSIAKKEHAKPVYSVSEEFKVFRPHLEVLPKSFFIETIQENGRTIFIVHGKKIEQIVSMTDFRFEDAVDRVYDVMGKLGITKELLKLGAKRGDVVRVGEGEMIFLG